MTRARELADLGNPNAITVGVSSFVGIGSETPGAQLDVGKGDLIVGAAITLGGPSGIISATTFSGNLSGNLSGSVTATDTTASTSKTTGALIVSGGVGIAKSLFVGEGISVGGTITYDDVTNIDSVGFVTAGKGFRATSGGIIVTAGVSTFSNHIIVGTGLSIAGVTTSHKARLGVVGASGTSLHVHGDARITGVITATKFLGNGSELTGVVSGIEVKSSGTSVGTSLTALNFSGATVSTGSAGITTVTIAAAGLETSSYSVPTAGLTTYLKLSDAQEHKLTASGITTITCYGGTEGDSHTLRIINSGITTIGFSTYFYWPSGSAPVMPTASGTISLISFTINRVGTSGTQLLAGASLNFS